MKNWTFTNIDRSKFKKARKVKKVEVKKVEPFQIPEPSLKMQQ